VEQPHICFSKMDRRYLVLGGEDAAGFGMLQKDPLDLLLGCLFFVRGWVLVVVSGVIRGFSMIDWCCFSLLLSVW
jgi:hypothetical protein